jgi:predicted nucleic acid-binding protein
LKFIPAQVVVTEVVKEKELITLQRLKDEENEGAIQFETAITQGLLLVVDFESELEEETFVNYAFELGDDGESATCAIAITRGWAIATDDKKAISFIQKEAPHLQILSTLEMIKTWSEGENLASDELRTLLSAIRSKGRYTPHRNHPLLSWWDNLIL